MVSSLSLSIDDCVNRIVLVDLSLDLPRVRVAFLPRDEFHLRRAVRGNIGKSRRE
jgi:hypothetical protein